MIKILSIVIASIIFVIAMLHAALWPRPFWWYWTKRKR